MPFIEVNGARLYYETFGTDQPDRAPILLIHGSTVTGRADWQSLAPLLATRYRVIVPDCRGHGQSQNTHSYSFSELAADAAALIRALGYERAHVIGHSNGGNVALVTLLEHPAVVQTCIVQAANAYVTDYLRDREPAIFDPDRVAREAPAWRDEMIALHAPTHGDDYWRELLALTLHAIITEPNYTPIDLARVQRPVLCIQGAADAVNAPDRHAEFIAWHIPAAELWVPAGVAHNVHLDAPLDWLARVFDFLERRGTDTAEALSRLKQSHYPDARQTIFTLRVADGALRGRVLTTEQQQAALSVLPPGTRAEAQVLLTDDAPWALINRSVGDVRRRASAGSEQLTQVLIGEAVRVLDEQDDWFLVRMERDGYLGWARARSVFRAKRAFVTKYQAAAKTMIAVPLARAFERPSPAAALAGQLPFGVKLPQVDQRGRFVALRLPDERVWWVAQTDVLPKVAWPKATRPGIAATLERIAALVGTPYLWGGCSPFGYDCSGLAQTFHRFMGVSIPRDADQQFVTGREVSGPPQPGDLLFFGGDDDDLIDPRHASITHVGLSLGGDELIHANGTTWNIAYNSLNPASPIYNAWLKEHLAGVRRFR